MNKRKDETGKKYGRLTVLEYVGNRKYKCKCECGNITYVNGKYLRTGMTRSCGCLRKELYNWNDLKGEKFGRLTAKEYLGDSKWLCKCECGKEIITKAEYLRSGHKKSCGCMEEDKKTLQKHISDKRAKRLYSIWEGMKNRCYIKSSSSYYLYGGKGIKVCDEWQNFNNFYEWAINNGYEEIEGEIKDKLSIDRIDSSKDYCPENCRWITLSENCSKVSNINKKLEELSNNTIDDMVKEYIERKMELNQEIQKEKREVRNGFFIKRNN